MTRITSSDQVLLYLRNRLLKQSKTRKPSGPPGKKASDTPRPTPLSRVKSLSSNDALSDDDIKKALIRGILSEELGSEIANDPAFQKLVGDIFSIMGEDKDTAALLSTTLDDLKAGSAE